MKKIPYLIVISLLLLAACKNPKKKSSADEIVKDTANATIPEPDKTVETLQALSPLSVEQIEANLPGEIMGAPKTNVSSENSFGTMMSTADYLVNDSIKINVGIADCAGPGGAGFYSMQYAERLKFPNDETLETSTIFDLGDNKAILSSMKNKTYCNLTYFTGKRFIVVIKGDVNESQIKDLASSLQIK